MAETLERRHTWSRIIGVERRQAPFHYLHGHPLPDPTRLEDEDFEQAEREREEGKHHTRRHGASGGDPDRFN